MLSFTRKKRMSAHQTRVKMKEHVLMNSIAIPANVPMDMRGHTVKQVS